MDMQWQGATKNSIGGTDNKPHSRQSMITDKEHATNTYICAPGQASDGKPPASLNHSCHATSWGSVGFCSICFPPPTADLTFLAQHQQPCSRLQHSWPRPCLPGGSQLPRTEASHVATRLNSFRARILAGRPIRAEFDPAGRLSILLRILPRSGHTAEPIVCIWHMPAAAPPCPPLSPNAVFLAAVAAECGNRKPSEPPAMASRSPPGHLLSAWGLHLGQSTQDSLHVGSSCAN